MTKTFITMYEFEDKKKARERFQTLNGNKVLSHVVYYNDQILYLIN